MSFDCLLETVMQAFTLLTEKDLEVDHNETLCLFKIWSTLSAPVFLNDYEISEYQDSQTSLNVRKVNGLLLLIGKAMVEA